MPTPECLIRYRRHFDAAHQLPYHRGKCARLHGHRWQIELAIRGPVQAEHNENPESGMVLDFGKLKALLDELLPDHYSMNAGFSGPVEIAQPGWSEWPGGGLENPTCERLAVRLYEVVRTKFLEHELPAALVGVRVWETPEADVTYPVPVWARAGALVMGEPEAARVP